MLPPPYNLVGDSTICNLTMLKSMGSKGMDSLWTPGLGWRNKALRFNWLDSTGKAVLRESECEYLKLSLSLCPLHG